jgi:hypothetical protein
MHFLQALLYASYMWLEQTVRLMGEFAYARLFSFQDPHDFKLELFLY